MPCPFEAKMGFTTKETRQEYLDLIAEKRENDGHHKTSAPSEEDIESLQANPDTSQPLYYWQLYSILGKDPIIECVTMFYTSIWADDDTPQGAKFKAAFANVGGAPAGADYDDSMKELHIKAQSAYWIDAFGGGKTYWGGHSRLGFHHFSRHAAPVMNADGAHRWMGHIRYALSSYDFCSNGYMDPRIIPCLVDFLHAKMRSYALDFEWKLDESDFEYEGFYYPPKHDLPSSDGCKNKLDPKRRVEETQKVRLYLEKFQLHS